jgi:methylmalonyl-CoA mutase
LKTQQYIPKNRVRIITATSLFDGHDAAINIMRRIMQSSGAEVIHMGHNRSVDEIVTCAIQEGVQGIAVSSYQGGHMEFFKYLLDKLTEEGFPEIKIFGGGGGVILPDEIKELHEYGITGIFSPDDGRKYGLQGIINKVLEACDFPLLNNYEKVPEVKPNEHRKLNRLLTFLENTESIPPSWLQELYQKAYQKMVPVVGVTGTGGSGKSSLTDELVRLILQEKPEWCIGIISVDPTKRKSGGALLGDRIRMNSVYHKQVFLRSVATRNPHISIPDRLSEFILAYKYAGVDLCLIETSGIGQSDSAITDYTDYSIYVMTPEYGAASQLEKIDMLDFADLVALNKFDKPGAIDALHQVKKQYQRNRQLFEQEIDEMPVFPTIAAQLNNTGVNNLHRAVMKLLSGKELEYRGEVSYSGKQIPGLKIPPNRVNYLSEIADAIRAIKKEIEEQALQAGNLYALNKAINLTDETTATSLKLNFAESKKQLDKNTWNIIEEWEKKKALYSRESFTYRVRKKEIEVGNFEKTLSHLSIPKIAFPRYKNWEDIVRWSLQENVPGEFPFTAGVYPFKREHESPTRMFAGEGSPERTNKRFHYLARGQQAKRLSTAFDSVTLYGEDPARQPDIFGKIGNSGVSVSCLPDAKKLYYGINLCDKQTSVSLTINGPAPTVTAFLLNAAIDQQCEIFIRESGIEEEVREKINQLYKSKGGNPPEYSGTLPAGAEPLGLLLMGVPGNYVLPKEDYERIKQSTLQQIRGTVQADILKEDQAQNTCIFSIDFSLQLMADIEAFFIQNKVNNFYSVSISGYHIAEAGANPITQLSFTLANGFTYVEYFLSRGMKIDDFAPHLSFFFSNGIDPEYSVMGRVARRIWSRAIKYVYGANERSQKLKYHIQTSGRSLHAQEVEFNDIRTTLQALYAIYDNCNSLHTNAYDEAITTPTEESVRRALAIQLIINQEFGLTKNQNPNQGSFIIEELTDLFEEAVLKEFENISQRGGVLGAMEMNYQRDTIQKESMHYEQLKNSGELPIIGVNTFLTEHSDAHLPGEVIRSTEEEKEMQLATNKIFKVVFKEEAENWLKKLKEAAQNNENVFEQLMEASKYCTLGQITQALYEVGGKYRRSM